MEVIVDGSLGWWCLHGDVLSQKLVVAYGNPAGAIYSHVVLIKLSDFNNNACLVPFGGMRTCLVMDMYMIADLQGWESLSVFRPPLSCFHVPVL